MSRQVLPGHTAAGHDGGQATVELALILPLITVVLLAVVHVALVARDQNLLTHAAREGARAAAVHHEPEAARHAAERAGPLDPDRMEVQVSGRDGVGSQVTVVVRYSSPNGIPLLAGIVGDTDLEARATMRVER